MDKIKNELLDGLLKDTSFISGIRSVFNFSSNDTPDLHKDYDNTSESDTIEDSWKEVGEYLSESMNLLELEKDKNS